MSSNIHAGGCLHCISVSSSHAVIGICPNKLVLDFIGLRFKHLTRKPIGNDKVSARQQCVYEAGLQKPRFLRNLYRFLCFLEFF